MTLGSGSWVWEIAQCLVGHCDPTRTEMSEQLLAEGWEPFAVTPSQYEGYVYHFRRQRAVEKE